MPASSHTLILGLLWHHLLVTDGLLTSRPVARRVTSRLTLQRAMSRAAALPEDLAPKGRRVCGFYLTNRVLNDDGGRQTREAEGEELVQQMRAQILRLYGEHLSDDGRRVDYEAMVRNDGFHDYLRTAQRLKSINLKALGEAQLRSLFLNIYNSMVIHAQAVGPIPKGLLQRLNFYRTTSYAIGGHIFSLDDIEHGVLRGNRVAPSGSILPWRAKDEFLSSGDPKRAFTVPLDPRIHFALNCGAMGCPPIRFYDSSTLDEDLQTATEAFLESVDVDVESGRVRVSQLLQWYMSDFGGVKEVNAMLVCIHKWLPTAKREAISNLLAEGEVQVEFEPYDWHVNSS